MYPTTNKWLKKYIVGSLVKFPYSVFCVFFSWPVFFWGGGGGQRKFHPILWRLARLRAHKLDVTRKTYFDHLALAFNLYAVARFRNCVWTLNRNCIDEIRGNQATMIFRSSLFFSVSFYSYTCLVVLLIRFFLVCFCGGISEIDKTLEKLQRSHVFVIVGVYI